MRGSHSKMIFTQSMFFKLLVSFLLVIFILSTFHGVAYNISIKNLEKEIVLNANERLYNIASKADKEIMQLENMLLKMSQESFFSYISKGKAASPYTQRLIVDTYNLYRTNPGYNVSCIHTVFILTAEPRDTIMTFESTYYTKTFFELFYSNPIYNESFWREEINDNFIIKYYPIGTFIDRSQYVYKNDILVSLMPAAVKANNNYNYIMVALIDIQSLLYSIDEYFADDFCIVDMNNTVLYSSMDSNLIEDFVKHRDIGYIKDDNGYLFIQKSPYNNLLYCKRLSKTELKRQLDKTNFTFKLITVMSLFISVLMSIYIVRRFNNPVRQIVTMLETHSQLGKTSANAVNFSYLQHSIQVLLNQNFTYSQTLESQESILEQLSYQAGIKNIYPDLKSYIDIKNNYFLIYFKIYFKPSYYENIHIDHDIAIYYLIEIIQFYVSSSFEDSVTFQVESDAIVSVINIYDKKAKEIEDEVNKISKKLGNEEEYLFFTIVFSKTCEDISQLNEAYSFVTEIAEYRQPFSTIQVLSDANLHTSCNKFYFSLEQEEQLLNLLYNGQSTECIDLIDETLEYNASKNVNCLYMQALCHEIANCCTKTLIKYYYDIPKEIESASIYFHIRECATVNSFKEVLGGYVSKVTEYINDNKKQYDYIIDNITSYVETHYAGDIYLDLLAERLNLSSNYISSYFKDKVGIGLNDYITNFRIRKSMELLGSTTEKVKDISTQVGFVNVNTFNRVFKRHTGETPTEYRRRLSTD